MTEEKRTQRPIVPPGIGRFDLRLAEAIGDKSVRSFADAAGISEGTVRNYVQGKRIPTLDRLAAMATAAGVSVIWLATGQGARDPDQVREGRADYAGLLKPDTVELAAAGVERWLAEHGGSDWPAERKGRIVRIVAQEIEDRGRDEAATIIDRLMTIAQPTWPE